MKNDERFVDFLLDTYKNPTKFFLKKTLKMVMTTAEVEIKFDESLTEESKMERDFKKLLSLYKREGYDKTGIVNKFYRQLSTYNVSCPSLPKMLNKYWVE